MRALARLAALAIAGPALAFPAVAQGVVARFDGWEARCEPNAGGRAIDCALLRTIATPGRPEAALTMILVRRAELQPLLRVLAPEGVLLPNGLELTLDGVEEGRAGFVRCLAASGCVAEVELDDDLLGRLLAGREARFTYWTTPDEPLSFVVPLAGLDDGYQALARQRT